MAAELILATLLVGIQYGIAALGFSISLNTLRIANLAYGQILVASGIALSIVMTVTGNFALAVGAGVVASIVLGAAVHLVAVLPLGIVTDTLSPRHIAVIVTTLGMALILDNVMSVLFGYGLRVPQVWPAIFHWGVMSRWNVLWDGCIAIGAAVLVEILLKRTTVGLNIRAITANPRLASIMGISNNATRWLVVLLSSATAGIAGVCIFARIGAVAPSSAGFYAFKAIVIAVAANRTSALALISWGLALSISETVAITYLGAAYKNVCGFSLLLIVILLRSYSQRDKSLVAC